MKGNDASKSREGREDPNVEDPNEAADSEREGLLQTLRLVGSLSAGVGCGIAGFFFSVSR